MIVKVSIDSYLGQQHINSLKIISDRLSFEQYIFITVDLYLLIKAMGLQWYRSMSIDKFNRFARVSIDNYCSTKQVWKGVHRHLQNAADDKNLLFPARLEFLGKTGRVPQYFQYKEVTCLFFSQNLSQILNYRVLICRVLQLCCSIKYACKSIDRYPLLNPIGLQESVSIDTYYCLMK